MMLFLILLATVQIILPDKLGRWFCSIIGKFSNNDFDKNILLISYNTIDFAGDLLYFFTIAYFAWLNVIMVNVWKSSVMQRWQIKERTWYILNHLYGWLVPLCLTAKVVWYWHFDGGFSGYSCWFSGKQYDKLLSLLAYNPQQIAIRINSWRK